MNPTKITVYKEYDKDGKITKKTVIKEYAQITLPAPWSPKTTPNTPWNPSQPWQQPLIYGKDTSAVPCDINVRIKGDAKLASVGDAIEAAFRTR